MKTRKSRSFLFFLGFVITGYDRIRSLEFRTPYWRTSLKITAIQSNAYLEMNNIDYVQEMEASSSHTHFFRGRVFLVHTSWIDPRFWNQRTRRTEEERRVLGNVTVVFSMHKYSRTRISRIAMSTIIVAVGGIFKAQSFQVYKKRLSSDNAEVAWNQPVWLNANYESSNRMYNIILMEQY